MKRQLVNGIMSLGMAFPTVAPAEAAPPVTHNDRAVVVGALGAACSGPLESRYREAFTFSVADNRTNGEPDEFTRDKVLSAATAAYVEADSEGGQPFATVSAIIDKNSPDRNAGRVANETEYAGIDELEVRIGAAEGITVIPDWMGSAPYVTGTWNFLQWVGSPYLNRNPLAGDPSPVNPIPASWAAMVTPETGIVIAEVMARKCAGDPDFDPR